MALTLVVLACLCAPLAAQSWPAPYVDRQANESPIDRMLRYHEQRDSGPSTRRHRIQVSTATPQIDAHRHSLSQPPQTQTTEPIAGGRRHAASAPEMEVPAAPPAEELLPSSPLHVRPAVTSPPSRRPTPEPQPLVRLGYESVDGDSPASPILSLEVPPPAPAEETPFGANAADVPDPEHEPNWDEYFPDEPLPPLEEELWRHGGSYLYAPEGDRLNWPHDGACDHYEVLRLPESWQEPRPATLFQDFLGADPIHPRPGLKWCGKDGFQWEPRFVGYGSYELFGIAFEEAGRRQDLIGHQLLVDLDLRLTGTERAHVQFRPLGRENTGGSYYQFSDPEGYEDNSTLVPDRYWIEGEFYSMFGGLLDNQFTPRDYHMVLGQFPFALHNSLLINDDILGFALSKNTIYMPPFSNLNVQLFAGLDEVDAFADSSADLFGVHLTADYRLALLEATYAWLNNTDDSTRDAHYAAFSATQFYGPYTLAGRALFKWQDEDSRGDGQLFVAESNFTRIFPHAFACATGVEHGVFYMNAFRATQGWNSISGGNFDRLRSAFEVDPLVTISRLRDPADSFGAALGVQLFRHHEDESIIPEIAYEERSASPVLGIGLRYLRKLGPRTFLEARGLRTWSQEQAFEQEGVFVSTILLF